MAFNRIVDFAKAQAETGATWTQWVHKSSYPALSVAGKWGDMSMGAGVPRYNAYVGTQYESTPMIGSGNFGIYHGGDQSDNKHLSEIMLQSNVASIAGSTFILCDYLMFYPLIDLDSTDVQTLDNVATLPRYESGDGVRAIMVITTPMATNNFTITVSYTNSAGVAGRVSQWNVFLSNVGELATGQYGTNATGNFPFLPLQGGDTGMRSIESFSINGSVGGFCSLVLVKPLATCGLTESTTAQEVSFVKDKMILPRIYNGAYLNFLYSGKAAVSGIFRAALTFNWG